MFECSTERDPRARRPAPARPCTCDLCYDIVLVGGAGKGWRLPLGCRSGSREFGMALCTMRVSQWPKLHGASLEKVRC